MTVETRECSLVSGNLKNHFKNPAIQPKPAPAIELLLSEKLFEHLFVTLQILKYFRRRSVTPIEY